MLIMPFLQIHYTKLIYLNSVISKYHAILLTAILQSENIKQAFPELQNHKGHFLYNWLILLIWKNISF